MKVLNKLFLLFSLTLLFSCKKESKTSNDSEIRDRYFQLEKRGWKSKTYNQLVDGIALRLSYLPICT